MNAEAGEAAEHGALLRGRGAVAPTLRTHPGPRIARPGQPHPPPTGGGAARAWSSRGSRAPRGAAPRAAACLGQYAVLASPPGAVSPAAGRGRAGSMPTAGGPAGNPGRVGDAVHAEAEVGQEPVGVAGAVPRRHVAAGQQPPSRGDQVLQQVAVGAAHVQEAPVPVDRLAEMAAPGPPVRSRAAEPDHRGGAPAPRRSRPPAASSTGVLQDGEEGELGPVGGAQPDVAGGSRG
jgi:hypothetical protein